MSIFQQVDGYIQYTIHSCTFCYDKSMPTFALLYSYEVCIVVLGKSDVCLKHRMGCGCVHVEYATIFIVAIHGEVLVGYVRD